MNNQRQIVAVFLTVAFLVPNISYAVAAVRTNAPAKVDTTQNFCTNVNSYTARIAEALTKNKANLDNRQEKNKENFQERYEKRSQALTETRALGDADRGEIYARLMAKATTDVQKQAVEEFKASVEAAVATRRSAVDKALKAYWDALDTALNGRQSSVDYAKQTFANAINTAVATAQSACSAGNDPATVRTQFNASVKAAKTQFATDRKAIDKYGPQVKAIVATRNAEVKKALEAFKVTMQQVRAALKAALGA